ncbi:hypothetical protein [uncultured Bacteroides sp.]|uniref:hypothetical protein n=1 Tax=uncultured Bacteroides sp. TaxID=162156 RepID=UPI00260E8400|nr:hypothetical protein [uncultured Bacteroides sp.]
MAKKIFIAYGDRNCSYSLKRIGKQAKRLNIFNEIILYTPDNLPSYLKESPLMQYNYGGGYWAWKPIIIHETLSKFAEGDIVCYVDAGCSLNQSIEWTIYFELMKEYDMVCFKYRDEYPEWEKFGSTSTKIKHWGKKNTLLFLDGIVGSNDWRECNKILGGFLFLKGKDNPILRQWIDIILTHPEVILDPTFEEMKNQYPYFALHKHDQVLLVALTYHYRERCIVLPETSETCGEKVAVVASRIRAANFFEYLENRFKYWGRHLLGDAIYSAIKYVCKRKL